jgi:Na+/melibiose symporter-like transporter
MNIESLLPFILLFSPFILAFIVEALVIYFFKLRPFLTSLGISVLVNLISIALIHFVASAILSKIGYELNGLNLQVQVLLFLCWFSIVVEGFVLQFLLKKPEKKKIFLASITMNALSFLFLYFFIEYSH